jgi:hypothetical protein
MAFHLEATEVATTLMRFFPHATIWIETETGAVLEEFSPAND